MKEGLLWFDKDPNRSLQEKIARACDRYVHKFGQQPNTCCVNPKTIIGHEDEKILAHVRVVLVPNVLVNNFRLGVSRPDDDVGRERAS